MISGLAVLVLTQAIFLYIPTGKTLLVLVALDVLGASLFAWGLTLIAD